MPNFNPEKPNFNTPNTGSNGESSEATRGVLNERGAKAYDVAKERLTAEERARLEERARKLREELGLPQPTSATNLGAEKPHAPAQETQKPISSPEPTPAPQPTPVPPTPDAPPSSPDNNPNSQPSKEEVKNTTEKAKKHPALRKIITGAAIAATAAIITAGVVSNYNNKDQDINSQIPPVATESVGNIENIDDNVGVTGEDQEKIGIIDGYDKKGLWLSENKHGNYDFACAEEVAEVCDNDECEMVKYIAENQVESMAAYMADLPKELQPDGFKGLTIAETEAKLESLSDEDYEQVQKEFNDAIGQAFTGDIEVDGSYANVYMDKEDASGNVDH